MDSFIQIDNLCRNYMLNLSSNVKNSEK